MKEKSLKSLTILDNEEFLRQVSIDVDISNDSDLLDDIATLEKYCKENDVLAMAAVQLGIPKRLIYLKNTNLELVNKFQTDSLEDEEKEYNEARVLINPVIRKREGLTEYWEACASCLDSCGKVLRPYKITLEYYDIDGLKHNEEFEGFESTVLSHEYDHLDGILHMDVALEVLYFTPEERKAWRVEHGYKVYAEEGDYKILKEKFKEE